VLYKVTLYSLLYTAGVTDLISAVYSRHLARHVVKPQCFAVKMVFVNFEAVGSKEHIWSVAVAPTIPPVAFCTRSHPVCSMHVSNHNFFGGGSKSIFFLWGAAAYGKVIAVKNCVLLNLGQNKFGCDSCPYHQWRFLEKIFGGLAPHHLGGNNG